MSNTFEVFIPILPPGVNETYGVNRSHKRPVFKKAEAVQWQDGAAKAIGAAAGEQGFIFGPEDTFAVRLEFHKSNYDVDAGVKITIDTLAQKLGFNDNRIDDLDLKIYRNAEEEGVKIIVSIIDASEGQQASCCGRCVCG